MRQVDQHLALTRKQKREMFEKHLSFQLRYAYESYARTSHDIELKLRSELERVQQPAQRDHATEMAAIWTKALRDFKRLANGSGSSEEVETFNMWFRKSYHSAEESPQTKLFSLD